METFVEKRVKLADVKKAMGDCTAFLKTYLPLSNAHAADFIIDNLWDKYIPTSIQEELLKMDEKGLAEIPSIALYLSQKSTENESENDISLSCCDNETKQSEMGGHHNLRCFIKDCMNHSFYGGLRKLLTSKQHIFGDFETDTDLNRREQLCGVELMSEKKSHEVNVLANLCASLAKKHSCKLIVDIGSGKGYLGTHLSSRYSLQTLSIDSSEQNTKSAIKRASNLQRRKTRTWSKQAEQITVFNKPTFCSSESSYHMTPYVTANTHPCISDSGENTSLKTCDSAEAENCIGCVPMGTVMGGHGKTGLAEQESMCTSDPSNGLSSDFVPITHFITPESNFLELLRKASSNENAAADSQIVENTSVLLTGLHTCGDLAPSVLKIFASSPEICVLCTVGCCYNLLTEEMSDSPQLDAGCGDLGKCDFGFPMSSLLQHCSFSLGKGARNLAAQSLHRISVDRSLQGKTFYDRALFEKIVVDLTGRRPTGQVNLRNLKKTSTSHSDYIRKAFIKFGLSTEKLTSELVDEYLVTYQQDKFKMAAFFQLRSLLAPCIETLILLDRACYLLEVDKVNSVDIIQLFDTYTSPRCYGLIATK